MEIFVARQPIFNEHKHVVAYEILYRNSHRNVYDLTEDGDKATASVVTDTLINFGLPSLTGGHPAFINFTKNLILDEMPTLFSPAQLTIEILEDIEIDPIFVEKVKSLKEKGYVIALDDYIDDGRFMELLPYVDIVKVDFLVLHSEGRKFVADKYRDKGIILLAEKVETQKDFEEGLRFGYTMFQGYFFEKPIMCTTKTIEVSHFKYLEILKETVDENADFNRIAEIVKSDVSLTYKLLRMINSPAFDIVSEVTSVNHALALLGLKEIRKWATLIMLRDMNTNKPSEVMRLSLTRAMFCERIAPWFKLESRQTELFILGLMSLIDTIMEMPLFDILDELPLKDDLKEALLGVDNTFHDVLRLVNHYEKGNWDMVMTICAAREIPYEKINEQYAFSLKESMRHLNE